MDALIKKFQSFSELKKYAKVAPDPELLGKIKVCTTEQLWSTKYLNSSRVREIIQKISSRSRYFGGDDDNDNEDDGVDDNDDEGDDDDNDEESDDEVDDDDESDDNDDEDEKDDDDDYTFSP